MAKSRRIFREHQHPRDDRGRFAKKGSGKWVARVVRTADAGFADTGQAQRGLRQGGLSGLIDLGKIRKENEPWVKRTADRIGEQRGIPKTVKELSISNDQVLVDGVWRNVTMTGWGSGSYKFGYRDDDDQSIDVKVKADEKLVTRPAVPDFKEPLRPRQHQRMAVWLADADKSPPFEHYDLPLPTSREARLAEYAAERREAEEKLKAAQKRARARANRKFPRSEGYGAYTRDQYIDQETWQEQAAVNMIDNQVRYITDRDDPSLDNRSTMRFIRLTGQLDSARPLAVYGDLLNIEDVDQGTFRHLRDLELLPVELHAIVAGDMARQRATRWSRSTGIWVGSRPVPQLDDADDMGAERPRGWGEDQTWTDVDGAYRPFSRTLLAGVTDVSSNRGEYHQAALHEFGHALDWAIGDERDRRSQLQPGTKPHYGAESASNEWLDLWRRVVDAAPDMSPYFRQPRPAGNSEMWAEAFGEWARARAKAGRRNESGDLVSVMGQRALISAFRIPRDQRALVVEMDAYFLGIMDRMEIKL